MSDDMDDGWCRSRCWGWRSLAGRRRCRDRNFPVVGVMGAATSGFRSDGCWPRFLLPRGEAAIRDCRVGFPSSLVSAVNWGRRCQSRRPLFHSSQSSRSLAQPGKGVAQATAGDRLHGHRAQITLSGNEATFPRRGATRHHVGSGGITP